MIARRTVIDQIEITRANDVQIRIALLLCDGEQELASKFHRTVILHGDDHVAQMIEVNRHLVLMGEEPVSQADIDRIGAYCAV